MPKLKCPSQHEKDVFSRVPSGSLQLGHSKNDDFNGWNTMQIAGDINPTIKFSKILFGKEFLLKF